MKELSFDNSLVGPCYTFFFSISDTNSLPGKLALYRWPTISSWLGKFFKPGLAPLSKQYVFSSSEKSDSGEHSLAYHLHNRDEDFQQIQIAAECMNHLAAGIDTTGDALCFLMYQISLPESSQVQDQLIAELSVNKHKAIDELLYLEAVIKEGLRCFPPIPMSQPRYVPSGGRIIDGYFIPGGTIVSCQAWSIHKLNEDVFVQGDKFQPERWLDPQTVSEMNKLFFSFGAGGRGCTGKQ